MKDITESELSLVEGGAVPWIVMLLGGAIVGAVANGWSDFKDGVAEAYARELNA
jgi:lactobin A/cerein 7B family class IIb bacteriocin